MSAELLKANEPKEDVEVYCGWKPFPGPQSMAYESEADIVGFGGAAGGGKTDFICGSAITQHKRVLVIRREKAQTQGIVQRLIELADGDTKGYSSQKSAWNYRAGTQPLIEFGGLDNPGDHHRWQGRPHDLKALDEVTEMREQQARFVMGWNRTDSPDIKCQVIMTFNPPTNIEGEWVIRFFAPWLDKEHSNPAIPGELRYFTTIGSNSDYEVPDSRRFVLSDDGEFVYDFDEAEYSAEKIITPKSRTFFPARVTDNPIYIESGYISTLQSLPEPLRSQMLYGDFNAEIEEDPWQVISTAAYDRSVKRWEARSCPSTAARNRLGLDVARGGKDNTVLAPIHSDGYCGELIKKPGTETRTGRAAAKLVYLNYDKDFIKVAVDVIGLGSSPVDVLNEEGFDTMPINGSGKAMVEEYGKLVPYTDPASGMKCVNLRSATIWNMRLLLEKDLIDLPPDPKLRKAALAHRWTPTSGGIKILSKDQVKGLIHFSPDEWDAVCYGYWLAPPVETLSLLDMGSVY